MKSNNEKPDIQVHCGNKFCFWEKETSTIPKGKAFKELALIRVKEVNFRGAYSTEEPVPLLENRQSFKRVLSKDVICLWANVCNPILRSADSSAVWLMVMYSLPNFVCTDTLARFRGDYRTFAWDDPTYFTLFKFTKLTLFFFIFLLTWWNNDYMFRSSISLYLFL